RLASAQGLCLEEGRRGGVAQPEGIVTPFPLIDGLSTHTEKPAEFGLGEAEPLTQLAHILSGNTGPGRGRRVLTVVSVLREGTGASARAIAFQRSDPVLQLSDGLPKFSIF